MKLIEFNNYRTAIKELIQEKKLQGELITFSKVAAKSGIQNTYFSNVLKERNHFNSDQIFSIGQTLNLTDDDIDYLLLLLEWERSANSQRKKILERKIIKTQRSHLKAEKHTKAKIISENIQNLAPYYLDPYMQIVHVLLYLDSPLSPKEIAKNLSSSLTHIKSIIGQLEEMGYIKKKDGAYKVIKKNFFLSKDSPLHLPHLSLLRVKSLEQLQKLPIDERQSISVTFTADEATKNKIEKEFMNFFSKCEKWVEKADAKKAYQLNFDLFPWEVS